MRCCRGSRSRSRINQPHVSRLFRKMVSFQRSSERSSNPTPDEEGAGQVGTGRQAMLGLRSHRCLLYNISLTCMIRVYILFCLCDVFHDRGQKETNRQKNPMNFKTDTLGTRPSRPTRPDATSVFSAKSVAFHLAMKGLFQPQIPLENSEEQTGAGDTSFPLHTVTCGGCCCLFTTILSPRQTNH